LAIKPEGCQQAKARRFGVSRDTFIPPRNYFLTSFFDLNKIAPDWR
jgi:hypothetical protein